jgi:hypothetical protein
MQSADSALLEGSEVTNGRDRTFVHTFRQQAGKKGDILNK